MRKLVHDGCSFEEPDAETPRRRCAARSSGARPRRAGRRRRARRSIARRCSAAAARERGTTADDVEAGLYADRAGAPAPAARSRAAAPGVLAAGFELARGAGGAAARDARHRHASARATPGTYRQLFRTLKFLRLLPVVTPAERAAATASSLDGPLSLFQGGTRYGLQLGARAARDRRVRHAGRSRPTCAGAPTAARSRFRIGGGAAVGDRRRRRAPSLPDELAAFVTAFERLESGWRVDRAPAVLDLPGAGVCVPDLAFVRARDGARVHFELLGFWSREAVWRRVELVRAGLPHRILFAVSKGLRVGEAVLDDDAAPPRSTSSRASSPPSRSSTASSASPRRRPRIALQPPRATSYIAGGAVAEAAAWSSAAGVAAQRRRGVFGVDQAVAVVVDGVAAESRRRPG